MLQAARAQGGIKVIRTSTSEVYGTPYSASKIGADQLAFSFHASFGLPVTIVRPFNTYGPRRSARAVIPTIITQIANGARSIKLGALHPMRDFSYVKDTMAAFIAALKSNAGVGQVVNFGTNFEIAIGDLARTIARLMRADIRIETEQSRLRPEASEVERLRADNGKAKRLLGWEPAYAGRDGLERGLAETIAWFAEPANLAACRAERYNV